MEISPEPVATMAARGPEVVVGGKGVQCMSVDWQICHATAKRLSAYILFQKTLENRSGAI